MIIGQGKGAPSHSPPLFPGSATPPSLPPPTAAAACRSLYPLPLIVNPSTSTPPTSRRTRAARAICHLVTAVANTTIRALNTLFFNYPSSCAVARGDLPMGSAFPSLAQQRLTAQVFDLAAAYVKARRHVVWSTEPGSSTGSELGGLAMIHDRTSPASSSLRPDYSSSLFIFPSSDAILLPPTSSHSVATSYFAVEPELQLHRLLMSWDTVPGEKLVGVPPADYSSDSTGILPIVAAKVALPSDLNNVAITSLLPERLAHLYNDPTTLLLPSAVAKQNLVDAGLRPPRVLAERAEYVALVNRMLQLGMLELTDSPRCINGLFGVPRTTSRFVSSSMHGLQTATS